MAEQENGVASTQNDKVEVVEPTTQPEQATLSKFEQQALDMGWRPQSEWKGDPEEFVSAKEFVQRKSFFDKISVQSQKIKELETTLSQFSEHFRKVEDYTRKQVLEELKAAKKVALEEGDPDKVIQIDEAITDFKVNERELQKRKEEEAAKKDVQLPPQLVAWKDKNTWYSADEKMTKYADKIAFGYKQMNPNATPSDVLAEIDAEVRERFPSYFENKQRAKPAAVEPSSGSQSKPPLKYDPTPEERRIALKFVKSGVYKTEEAYFKALRDMGGKE